MELAWEKINEFLLTCGTEHDPMQFSRNILDHIGSLIPFDQGRLYFLDANGNVFAQYCIGVDKDTVKEYHEYSPSLDDGRFSIKAFTRNFSGWYPPAEKCVLDYDQLNFQIPYFNSLVDSEFLREYILPHRLRHSFGLALRDSDLQLRCIYSLDRVGKANFTQKEIQTMSTLRPHLDNLYQNFYIPCPDDVSVSTLLPVNGGLTRREAEIAELLREGVTPEAISRKLCISPATVKKHIANIHAKLHVTSRQELILRLIQMSGETTKEH